MLQNKWIDCKLRLWMQWEEVQINIELTLNISEKIEKATTENLESSLGWSDFPKRHAVIRPSGKSSCSISQAPSCTAQHTWWIIKYTEG